jgi:hypothetical protein
MPPWLPYRRDADGEASSVPCGVRALEDRAWTGLRLNEAQHGAAVRQRERPQQDEAAQEQGSLPSGPAQSPRFRPRSSRPSSLLPDRRSRAESSVTRQQSSS